VVRLEVGAADGGPGEILPFLVAEHQPISETGCRVDRIECLGRDDEDGLTVRVRYEYDFGNGRHVQSETVFTHCLPPPPEFCTT